MLLLFFFLYNNNNDNDNNNDDDNDNDDNDDDNSIDKPQDLDLEKFKNSYDVALSSLFDKQFGMLETSREEEFQNSINYLQETLRRLISERKERINDSSVDGGDLPAKDMLDILVTGTDPETGRPYTDEMVGNE